jgi:hypothetical protein
MRLYLLHLDDEPSNDPREETYVVVPGLGQVVLPVAIDALPGWLPALDAMLDTEFGELPCPDCGVPLVTAETTRPHSGTA